MLRVTDRADDWLYPSVSMDEMSFWTKVLYGDASRRLQRLSSDILKVAIVSLLCRSGRRKTRNYAEWLAARSAEIPRFLQRVRHSLGLGINPIMPNSA
jgi:hypothetical protein